MGLLLTYFPTFVPKRKNDKILKNSNSLYLVGLSGVCVWGWLVDLLSKFCSWVQKSQNPKFFCGWGRVGLDLLSNLCSWVHKWRNPKFPLPDGVGVVDLLSNFCFWVQKWQIPIYVGVGGEEKYGMERDWWSGRTILILHLNLKDFQWNRQKKSGPWCIWFHVIVINLCIFVSVKWTCVSKHFQVKTIETLLNITIENNKLKSCTNFE